MEMAILEDSSYHEFDVLHFGFIEKRGTTTAIGLAKDIIQHFNKRGSPVHYCALDAAMAFDGILDSILLQKAIAGFPVCFSYKIPG